MLEGVNKEIPHLTPIILSNRHVVFAEATGVGTSAHAVAGPCDGGNAQRRAAVTVAVHTPLATYITPTG